MGRPGDRLVYAWVGHKTIHLLLILQSKVIAVSLFVCMSVFCVSAVSGPGGGGGWGRVGGGRKDMEWGMGGVE